MSDHRTPWLRHTLLALGGTLALVAIGSWAIDRDHVGDAPLLPEAAAPPPASSDVAARPVAPDPVTREPVAPEPVPPVTAPEAFEPSVTDRVAIDRPITDLDPETRAALEARLARQEAAEARFEQGIESSQVRARDIDTRVREAFRRVQLEPVLLDGGLMRGLRIHDVEGGSPFQEAGFRAGDLLVSLDERPLDDPAALPDLLASIGPVLSVCARRGDTELCRELILR